MPRPPKELHVQDIMLSVLACIQAGDADEGRRILGFLKDGLPNHPIIPIFDTLLEKRVPRESGNPRESSGRTGEPQLSITPVLQNVNRFYDDILIECWGDRIPHHCDIADHLGTLFYEAVVARPSLIVELGVGASTKALIAAACRTDATMLSIDRNLGREIQLSDKARKLWSFVRTDDVKFAQTGFRNWCDQRRVSQKIDFLFIDTSHRLEHTRSEIAAWFPLLAESATVVFHDTNLQLAYLRRDGTATLAYTNNRGVIKPIEEYLDRKYDERTSFVDFAKGWIVKHDPICNGLLVMRRIGAMP
jgi:hypothetical protein